MTASSGAAAWDIYRAHWRPAEHQRLRRARHLAAYAHYCHVCWDLRRDVRSAPHLQEALKWFSRFCLLSEGHDGWGLDMLRRRYHWKNPRRTVAALVALPPLRSPTATEDYLWSGRAKDVLWKKRYRWFFGISS